jgi:hypothetical protein
VASGGAGEECEDWFMDPCEDDDDPGDDYPVGGGSTGGSTGGPGGGTTTDPTVGCTPSANGTVCETLDRPECRRPVAGSDACVTRDPKTTAPPGELSEWDQIGVIVNRMTANTAYCRRAKELAQQMYAAGPVNARIILWDGRNYVPNTNMQRMLWGRNGADARGRKLELDSYLVFNTRSLLAHEALHSYLNDVNSPMSATDQEIWVREHETECAG